MTLQLFTIISAILLSIPILIGFQTKNNKFTIINLSATIALIMSVYVYNFVL